MTQTSRVYGQLFFRLIINNTNAHIKFLIFLESCRANKENEGQPEKEEK